MSSEEARSLVKSWTVKRRVEVLSEEARRLVKSLTVKSCVEVLRTFNKVTSAKTKKVRLVTKVKFVFINILHGSRTRLGLKLQSFP